MQSVEWLAHPIVRRIPKQQVLTDVEFAQLFSTVTGLMPGFVMVFQK